MTNYRLPLLSLVFLGMLSPTVAQNPLVQQIIDEVNIDSLMHDLGLLSGEAPVNVGNGDELIVSRNKNQPGNPLAADWLQQRFEQLGYSATVQVFSAGTGENIIAEKVGSVHPERKVVICGHYDAMPGGPVAAPAADDDGSGTVAVLEAVRVLSPYTFENTIVFALWDEEEQGKLGSIFYAGVAAGNDVEITGVVNLDAISYDGDGDGLMRVHTKTIANSIALKDSAVMVNTTYAGLDLPMAINLPGATYSDHASFWSENYGAILIIEDFDNDGNPHYHTSTDLVDFIDQPYFHGLARLGIGTTAVLAIPVSGTTAITESDKHIEDDVIFVYPNPVHGTTRVHVTTNRGQGRLSLHNSIGQELSGSSSGMLTTGKNSYSFNAQELAPGAYVLRFVRNGIATALPIVRLP